MGRNLQNGRRYIVAMRGLKNSGGSTLAASPLFATYRDGTPTDQLPVRSNPGRGSQLGLVEEARTGRPDQRAAVEVNAARPLDGQLGDVILR